MARVYCDRRGSCRSFWWGSLWWPGSERPRFFDVAERVAFFAARSVISWSVRCMHLSASCITLMHSDFAMLTGLTKAKSRGYFRGATSKKRKLACVHLDATPFQLTLRIRRGRRARLSTTVGPKHRHRSMTGRSSPTSALRSQPSRSRRHAAQPSSSCRCRLARTALRTRCRSWRRRSRASGRRGLRSSATTSHLFAAAPPESGTAPAVRVALRSSGLAVRVRLPDQTTLTQT